MAIAVPPAGTVPERCTAARYFDLVDGGVLGPDDAVELLEGVVVAMAPSSPRHAAATSRGGDALRAAVGGRAAVREQHPLILGVYSVPEPDVAVVAGRNADYDDAHPRAALLVVEVADTSLAQDRLTKAAIYAAAAIPEFWIVNLREDRVEVFRAPDPPGRKYTSRSVARRGDDLELVALLGARVAVSDILPGAR